MCVRTLLAFSVVALAACATKSPPVFSLSEACSTSAPAYDAREVQCQFPKTELARKFRLKANFSGGHDDTAARLEPFVNNSSLNCQEGSKTHLFAEDGDVSLWCIFSVADLVQDDGVFKVRIRWSHAEYMSYEVIAQ